MRTWSFWVNVTCKPIGSLPWGLCNFVENKLLITLLKKNLKKNKGQAKSHKYANFRGKYGVLSFTGWDFRTDHYRSNWACTILVYLQTLQKRKSMHWFLSPIFSTSRVCKYGAYFLMIVWCLMMWRGTLSFFGSGLISEAAQQLSSHTRDEWREKTDI